MLPLLNKAKDIVLDILFPPLCLNCHKALIDADKRRYLCDNCFDKIKLNYTLFCPICRARLAENKRICSHTIAMQINTDKTQNFYYFLAAAGNYDDPVLQNLIHYFKYKSFKNLAPILGEIVIKYLGNCKLKIENFIVVPIPLHPRRERQRGFNQAKLIAGVVAQNFNLELVDGLKRVKNNQPQAKIKDHKSRAKNMANCFEIKNPQKIKGKNILLVDDVFTSGATMNEAVKILKQNGAKKIIALVVAKA